MIVLIKHTNNILWKLSLSKLIEVIRPTPAGIKKKAKLSKKNLLTLFICSNFIILNIKESNNIIIAIIFPGTGTLNILWISSPKR